MESMMGPNALWLAEWLSQAMELRPGMRVLDLGCGKASSSIFLAREFGVTVYAADLWIKPGENWHRIQQAGVSDKVIPIDCEAHALPFAESYFDAIVSMDAYHYFGTDDLYLGYCTRFLRPGGQIGIVVPGGPEELKGVPSHLETHWQWEFCTFHTPAWWRRHWKITGRVEVEIANAMPDGWRHWLDWDEACHERKVPHANPEMLRVDAGRTFGFVRVVGRKYAS
jgi:cyclopropane fatty-acyl-phospholipid synthase-like methyltransferase